MNAPNAAAGRPKGPATTPGNARTAAAASGPAGNGTPGPDAGWISRVRGEIDLAIQRSVKGIDLLGAPAEAVGGTPKDVVLQRGTLCLYHYRPMTDEIYRVPLLLVMATTNKAYIFDLAPGQSLIEYLLRAGHDVYVMDWNAPRQDEKDLRIEDYTLDFIPRCIAYIQKDSGIDDVNVVGYCMGGVLSTIYAALHADGPLANLVCFTTPIDFRGMQLFRAWSDDRHFDVDRLVETTGVVPSDFIQNGFEMLRPSSRMTGTIRLWDNLWNDEFVRQYRRMNRWGTETLPLAGAYFRQTIVSLMRNNELYEGTLRIGGRTVDLGAIRVPLLSFVAEHDHIVPYESSHPLVERVSSVDKEEVVLKGGHVSLIAGPNAVRRMWPKLDQWLGERST